ncbi:protein FLUORESCENT IN BLUE LIGHT, chloroplastic-like isoform X2 [Lolium perenne]|uniref:protein FLUORESCENT IN BLUE LIGHT, chloroplastic-like isoform X2 n=1 Tax=Lolium perenne TaxID=4522 RepID=UPI0021F65A3A|nr:protein FLUORESCENT IN BLUE LIGHT, chloroplastic-like isoform X2 [Lolium perenne]
MQAAASYRCAAAHRRSGEPSSRPLVPSLLLPGRVSRFYDAAAVPLRVCSPPLPLARGGGGDSAHLDARNGEARRLMRALGRILPDHQKMAHVNLLRTAVLSTMSILIMPLEASAETCQPANSFADMPIFIAVALIGAAVGGLLARQRKEELKRLNNQLRQINTALRRQAQIESFAPGLTYAPVGRATETEVIVDPRKQQLVVNLKNGKNYMRNQDLDKAVTEFRTALELAESIGDRFEEKKGARGLGASLQRLGQYKEAMSWYYKVLELSKETGEDSGCTEAYGAIADCYAELGDLERAAKLYDKYISRLQPHD